MSFWSHLDVLRGVLWRVAAVVLVCGVGAFAMKDMLFDVLLAPKSSDFITYRLMGVDPFSVHLINVGLTEQFMMHMKAAMAVGALVACPYIIYSLYGFIAPALYEKERYYAVRVATWGCVLFMVGVVINYFVIFPLTVHFLATYEVSPDVESMLSLQSYIDTLISMSMVFGIVFEIPAVAWLLGKMGVLKAEWMRQYRRHAIVVILVVAAIITPTTDAFTLSIVALPIWALYELSVLLVRTKNY